MRFSSTTSLAHALTLQDVVDFLKEVRNVETSKVVSLTASIEAPTKATEAPTKTTKVPTKATKATTNVPTEGKHWPLPQLVSFQASETIKMVWKM
jgi:cell division septation protein DedD